MAMRKKLLSLARDVRDIFLCGKDEKFTREVFFFFGREYVTALELRLRLPGLATLFELRCKLHAQTIGKLVTLIERAFYKFVMSRQFKSLF